MHIRYALPWTILALSLSSTSAFAVDPGVDVTTTAIKNPITGADFNAWKLVGTSCASAVQIHKNWLVASQHCMPGQGATFTSPYGSAVIDTCYPANDGAPYSLGDTNDFSLCRLRQPTQLSHAGAFPALVSAPSWAFTMPYYAHPYVAGNLSNAEQRQVGLYGALLAYGFGCCNRIGVVDFTGLPLNQQMALSAKAVSAPRLNGGDSGGAAYWASPTMADPALVGLLTTGYAVPRGITYFTENSVNWIRNKITAAGDSAPTTYTASQFYTGTTAPLPPHLATAPTLVLVNGVLTLSWQMPSDSGSNTITGYQVTVARQGAVQSTLQINGAGTTQTALPVGAYSFTACVRTRNTSGLSIEGLVTETQATPYGCKDFDLTAPSGLNQAVARDAATGLFKFSLNWTAPFPAASNTRYRITRTTKVKGVQRTSTVDTTTTSNVAYVQAGSYVCQKVTVFSDLNPVGTSTGTVCATAN